MDAELKIVIVHKDNRASVGIQGPECDPVLSLVNGTLPEILAGIPSLVEQARAKWEETPRYPKCETKLEPTAARPQPASRAVSRTEDVSKPRLF
jgi:hypothetical protein